MKKKKEKSYRVRVNCPDLKLDRTYRVCARSKNAAWDIASRLFFAQFPEVLERGLPVGC